MMTGNNLMHYWIPRVKRIETDEIMSIAVEQMELQGIPNNERMAILERYFGLFVGIHFETYAERVEAYEELFPPEVVYGEA